MDDNKELIAQCEAKAKLWLAPAFDEETRKSVQSMLDNEDKTDLIESFYKTLNLVLAACVVSWEQVLTA